MSFPKNKANSGTISTGKRLNKKPAIIATALVGLTIGGMYYAGSTRSKKPVDPLAGTAGEEMLEMAVLPNQAIEFLKDEPDGLAGVNRELYEVPEVDEDKERVSNLSDRMLDQYEQRQLRDAEKQAAIREKILQQQIDMAQQAMTSGTSVEVFGTGSEFRNERENAERKRQAALANQPRTAPEVVRPPPPPVILSEISAASKTAAPAIDVNSLNNPAAQELIGQLPPQYQDIINGLIGGSEEGGNRNSRTVSNNASGNLLDRGERDFTLRNKLEQPATDFELKTGTIMPGAMINAARSDLPGDIVGQITQNVYDTATGRYLLVPQGTKLYGKYDAFTQFGQERLLIAWDRMIFPDAETLDIGGMQGYDAYGQSGVTGRVNNHFVEALGAAFMISLVDAAGQSLANATANNTDNSFIINLGQGLSETGFDPFNEYLTNKLNVRPTISIKSGDRFNIMISKDIVFNAPYEYGYFRKVSKK